MNQKLKEIVLKKPFSEMRMYALNKFISEDFKDEKQGLGIKSNLSWLNKENVLEEGKTLLRIEPSIDYLYDNDIIILNGLDVDEADDLSPKEKNSIKEKIYSLCEKKNKLDHIHTIMNDTLIIYIRKNSKNSDIINIIKRTVRNTFNHLLIILEENTKAKIFLQTIPNIIQDKNNKFSTEKTEIFMGENAFLDYYEITNPNKNTFIYSEKKAIVEHNSELNWHFLDLNSKQLISKIHTILNGANSRTKINSLYLADNSNSTEISLTSEHEGTGTYSLLNNRGILKSASSLIRGLVKINENAQDSNGYQKTEALMLDNKSKTTSIPDLEIHNDKVKCSHGATITRMDKEKLFYLRSRGLKKEEAEELLLKGFYNPLLEQIDDEYVKEYFKKTIEDKLSRMEAQNE